MSLDHDITVQTVSDLGLKLIKTFEGYRGKAAKLVTGQDVVGYGHPLSADDDGPRELSRAQAVNILREDLAPVEAMIRETIFTPLSQGQFDALCSLVFNIGPVNFMTSNLRHALNNGRVLDAAGAFDEWRKADIDGQVYVVDALVRRRTAEKALFLRADNAPVRASNASMTVKSDSSFMRVSDEEVFDPDAGIVNSEVKHNRRAEDRGGILTLTERAHTDEGTKSVYDPINYADEAHMDAAIENHLLDIPHPNAKRDEVETVPDPSPIALAAAEVSDRLDALIDSARLDTQSDTKPAKVKPESDLPVAANSNEGRPRRPKAAAPDHARKFIEPAPKAKKPANQSAGAGVYGLFMFIGGCLLAAGLTLHMTARASGGQMGAFLTPWAIIIGGLLLLGGLYYGFRALRRERAHL